MTVVAIPSHKIKMARLQQPSDNDPAFRAMDRILARSFVRELLRRRARSPLSPFGAPRTYQPRQVCSVFSHPPRR